MIEMRYTSTGRIYSRDGNVYELIEYANGSYMLITNKDKTYSGLDVTKFDIKKHLV